MRKLFFLLKLISLEISFCHAININGIYYDIVSESERTVIIRAGGMLTGDIVIPEKVTYDGYNYWTVIGVGDHAFARRGITTISLPPTIESIGTSAFYMTGLTSFTVPANLNIISSDAFELTYIQSFSVDPFNKKFKAMEGVLYSFDMKTLLHYPPSKNLNNFSIPEGVENIGPMAFCSNKRLNTINIPNTVKSIGYFAFLSNSITSLFIPASVTNISSTMCRWCMQLTSYVVDPANKRYRSADGVIFSKDMDTLVVYPVAKAGESYSIPNTVKLIGPNAFSDNYYNLFTVIIPYGVLEIADAAFSDCRNFRSVIIPESMKFIGNRAFAGCTQFESIDLHDGIESIGKDAFYGCEKIRKVVLPASMSVIQDGLFMRCKNLTSVGIPGNLKRIGSRAFRDCTELNDVGLPEGLESIDNEAFYGCGRLNNISIPESVRDIGQDAFEGTAWLNGQQNGLIYINNCLYKYKGTMPAGQSLEVKPNTVQICGSAFSGCAGLVSLKLPVSLQSIGPGAFSGCIGLKDIVFPQNLTTIGPYAFSGSGITSLTIPENVVNFTSLGKCKSLKSVVIRAKLNAISNDAFAECTSLDSIVLPESIKSIGAHAFYLCTKLTSINLPAGLNYIGDMAFAYSSLNLIRSQAILPPELGTTVFYGVSKWAIVQVPTGSRTFYSNAKQWKDFHTYDEINFRYNYEVRILNVTCPGSNDGRIEIKTLMPNSYILNMIGTNYSETHEFKGNSYTVLNLIPGSYRLEFSVLSHDTLKQTYHVVISEPEELGVYKVMRNTNHVSYALSGADKYFVTCNNKTIEALSNNVEIELENGENIILIRSDKPCQGIYKEKIFIDSINQVRIFPNPIENILSVCISGRDDMAIVQIHSINGSTLLRQILPVLEDRTVNIDLSFLKEGSYLLNVITASTNNTLHFLKR